MEKRANIYNAISMEGLLHLVTDMDVISPMLKITNPKPFIHDRSVLSEFLSICNLGTKDKKDHFLIHADDPCETRAIMDCETDKQCKVYKDKCVNPSRIQPFRELSKEMGHRIQGKFTMEPFEFIIHDSSHYYKIILSMKTKRVFY